jgi:hypothetical protein
MVIEFRFQVVSHFFGPADFLISVWMAILRLQYTLSLLYLVGFKGGYYENHCVCFIGFYLFPCSTVYSKRGSIS